MNWRTKIIILSRSGKLEWETHHTMVSEDYPSFSAVYSHCGHDYNLHLFASYSSYNTYGSYTWTNGTVKPSPPIITFSVSCEGNKIMEDTGEEWLSLYGDLRSVRAEQVALRKQEFINSF